MTNRRVMLGVGAAGIASSLCGIASNALGMVSKEKRYVRFIAFYTWIFRGFIIVDDETWQNLNEEAREHRILEVTCIPKSLFDTINGYVNQNNIVVREPVYMMNDLISELMKLLENKYAEIVIKDCLLIISKMNYLVFDVQL